MYQVLGLHLIAIQRQCRYVQLENGSIPIRVPLGKCGMVHNEKQQYSPHEKDAIDIAVFHTEMDETTL